MAKQTLQQPRAAFKTDRGDARMRAVYGKGILVTHLGHIRIVHCDNPTPEKIEQRIDEVLREEFSGEALDPDCPLCRQLEGLPYDVVYHGEAESGGS